MPIRLAAFAAALLVAAGCHVPRQQGQKQDPKTPVARVGGQVITAGELDASMKKELQQIEQQHQEQLYRMRRQALESMLRKRAFEAKAKEKGVTPEQLIESEVTAKIAQPPDEEIKALYDRAKESGQQLPPFDEVKGDIARFIKNQKGQGAVADYYETLEKEMKIEVLLKPYEPPKVAVDTKGPSKGPAAAPVTIVEFSDYECPYCARVEPTVRDLLASYPGKIRLVYRDYPLPMHPHAPKAAEASHCADDQGKYWEMHDKLFASSTKLEPTDLKAYARDVGLDGEKFDKCLESGEKAKVVAMHRQAGEDAGVSGTPAFFINGRPIAGAQPLSAFKALVDDELKGK